MKIKNIKKEYDVLIIGGGISASVFVSDFLKKNIRSKIAIIEAGRGLGGRCSTRISKRFKNWKLNHGSPYLNICNRSKNESLKYFINELLINKLIEIDHSELIRLHSDQKLNSFKNYEFNCCDKYISIESMGELCQKIVALNNLRSQIDFFFETLIIDLEFNDGNWILTSKNGEIFKSRFLVCSSNLILHKRSIEILNINQIPIRKAIPKNSDHQIDSLIKILDKQTFIPRLTFLIYTKSSYKYKDVYSKKYRYFELEKNLEKKYKFERVIFQLQKNNKLGIVIHTKDLELINSYLEEKKEGLIKNIILKSFNNLFEKNPFISPISDKDDISIMSWRASQPAAIGAPLALQFCRKYNIGFCGDWFRVEGFGRIEGAILSALELSNKFNYLI